MRQYWSDVLRRAVDEVWTQTPWSTWVKFSLWLSTPVGGTLAWLASNGWRLDQTPPIALIGGPVVAVVVAIIAALSRVAAVPPKLAVEANTRHVAELDAFNAAKSREIDEEHRVASQQAEELRSELQRATEQLEAAKQELRDLKRPALRDSSAIYQFGKKVARAHGVEPHVAAGVVRFRTIETSGDFNTTETFEWNDFVLKADRPSVVFGEGFAGGHATMGGFSARIVGRLGSAAGES